MDTYHIIQPNGLELTFTIYGTEINCRKLLNWHEQLFGCVLGKKYHVIYRKQIHVDALFNAISMFNEEYQKTIINQLNLSFQVSLNFQVKFTRSNKCFNIALLKQLTGIESIAVRSLRK